MQALWMIAASLFFAFMGMFIKLSASYYNLGEIVLFRGIPSVLLIAAYAFYHRLPILGQHLKTHARRNISGITSMWLGFYSTTLLPQGTASALKYTSPLFIAAALLYQSYFPGILKAQWMRFGAIILGFIGVLCIFNPLTETGLDSGAFTAGLISGFMGATAYMTVRSLGRIGEPEWRTVLLFSICVVLSGLLGIAILGVSDYSLGSFMYLLGIGLSGFGGQLCMTRAFSRGSTTMSATLQYTGIIFSSLIGYEVWGETLDLVASIGIILVIISGVGATLYARSNTTKG